MRWEYVSGSQIGPTPVVIVTYARSGSTFLGAVLKINKDVLNMILRYIVDLLLTSLDQRKESSVWGFII
jgi:hypothetical protein